jgi:hypothetical protein
MGGHPWWYLVPYENDIAGRMDALRHRKFKAGRYNSAESFPRFPVDPEHAPGCKHSSTDGARDDSDADGTRSILDVSHIGEKPDYDVVARLAENELLEFFQRREGDRWSSHCFLQNGLYRTAEKETVKLARFDGSSDSGD